MFDQLKKQVDQLKQFNSLMKDGNFRALLSHPKFVELFKDPDFQELVKKQNKLAASLLHWTKYNTN